MNEQQIGTTTLDSEALFNNAVQRITAAYDVYGHELGWRFLTAPKSNLHRNVEIALITTNPAGDRIPPDHPWESNEDGSAYLTECWGNSSCGQSPLQKQIQALFSKLTRELGRGESMRELLNNSLAAHFIPFRSPRLDQLVNKSDSVSFSRSLWTELLTKIRPKLLICMDKVSYAELTGILRGSGFENTESQSERTGWGNITATIDFYDDKLGSITVLRLPHLSTFKLFSRSECDHYVDKIIRLACSRLNAEQNSLVTP